jgi:hypothetical protein
LPLAEADVLKRDKDHTATFITGDSSGLGSRHRAAMGISSGSDATCVVVSEETGAISIAESGKLTVNVTESQLRSHLISILSEGVIPPFSGVLDWLRKRHA